MPDGSSLLEAIRGDFQDIGDLGRMIHVLIRLLVACILGGLLGYERERTGKAAGLRTHMLVTLGSAFFVVVPQLEGTPTADMTRVIQGIVTGIGFLGGGAILKLADDKEIHGLTTAAGIWLCAAIGIAVGSGRIGTAVLGTVLAFVILGVLSRWEGAIQHKQAVG